MAGDTDGRTCDLNAEDCKQLLDNQKTLQSDITLIKNALLGSEYQPVGVIEQVRRNKKEIGAIKRVGLSIAGAFGFIMGGLKLWSYIKDAVS